MTAIAATAAGTLLVGTAWAQTVPSASPTGTPAPSPTTSAPAVDPTAAAPGTASSAAASASPVDSGPALDLGPSSGAAPGPRTAPTAPAPAPAPSSSGPDLAGGSIGAGTAATPSSGDGVDPASGQVDDYLVASSARDEAARVVVGLTASSLAAQSTVADLVEGRRLVALETARARVALSQAQSSTDDVVRDLYQQGDAGIGAFATILSSGPEGLLDRVDNARMATSTAYGVVDRTDDARLRLTLALAAEQAYDARVAAARSTADAVQRRLDAARIALATAEAQLTSLGAAAPQVAIGVDGCPTVDVPATLRDGADLIGAATLCRSAVRQAATPQAALALTWAFQHLGAVYACKGAGRMQPWRADCSSFVSRAYAEGAGLGTAGADWAPSTRDMVPWDGVALDPHYAYVAPAALRPGDLVLYDTCPQGGCPYKHVVMYLGSPDHGRTRWMLHTNACGDIAKVTAFWGFPTSGHPFLVARRVIALDGETVRAVAPAEARLAAMAATHRAAVVVAELLRTG